MKKNIVIGVLMLIVGTIGGWLCRGYHFRDTTKMFQSDTVTVFDTMRYSRLELVRNTYRLDIPKIDNPRMVLVPADSATIIYRDSVRYVTLPRQYFYTKVEDAEIWHSGIDSTIDSLNVVRKTQEVTKTAQTKPKLNSIGIGVGTTYMTALSTPIYIEYERMLKPWLSVYGQIAYDLPWQKYGVGIGLKAQIEW